MDQPNTSAKLAGRAGALIALVGLVMFFGGVFSLIPRMFVFAGVALIVMSLAAYYIEELILRQS